MCHLLLLDETAYGVDYIQLIGSDVEFSLSLLTFCLQDLSISNREAVKFPPVIVD